MEFPKRVFIRANQPYREFWVKYFERQYQEECVRLNIHPEPLQEEQIALPF